MPKDTDSQRARLDLLDPRVRKGLLAHVRTAGLKYRRRYAGGMTWQILAVCLLPQVAVWAVLMLVVPHFWRFRFMPLTAWRIALVLLAVGSLVWLSVLIPSLARMSRRYREGDLRLFIADHWVNGRPMLCYACGYEMAASRAEHCPECGAAVPTAKLLLGETQAVENQS